jgi:molecular chaperone DnaJ
MHRDLYVVLGVSRTETPDGIRKSFRELAFQYHPDHAGAREAQHFRDVVEAYGVLSDARRRAAYDDELARTERPAQAIGPTPRVRVEPLVREPRTARPPAEPLVPEPISLLRDFEAGRPSVEEVFDRFVQSFTGRHAAKSRTVTPVHLEIEVSPEQAFRGGTLAISVPVLYPCAECGGTGRDWLYLCTGCRGRGIVAAEEAVRFQVPPRLRDGDVLEVPLAAVGAPDQRLRIAFRLGA